MSHAESRGSQTLEQLPTVSELAAMTDAELAARHDAEVARSRLRDDPATYIYLGELGRRMQELRDERTVRIALAALIVSAVTLIVTAITLGIVL